MNQISIIRLVIRYVFIICLFGIISINSFICNIFSQVLVAVCSKKIYGKRIAFLFDREVALYYIYNNGGRSCHLVPSVVK